MVLSPAARRLQTLKAQLKSGEISRSKFKELRKEERLTPESFRRAKAEAFHQATSGLPVLESEYVKESTSDLARLTAATSEPVKTTEQRFSAFQQNVPIQEKQLKSVKTPLTKDSSKVRSVEVYWRAGTGEQFAKYDTGEVQRIKTQPIMEIVRGGGSVNVYRDVYGTPQIKEITYPESSEPIASSIYGGEIYSVKSTDTTIVKAPTKKQTLSEKAYGFISTPLNFEKVPVIGKAEKDIKTLAVSALAVQKVYSEKFKEKTAGSKLSRFGGLASKTSDITADFAISYIDTMKTPSTYLIAGATKTAFGVIGTGATSLIGKAMKPETVKSIIGYTALGGYGVSESVNVLTGVKSTGQVLGEFAGFGAAFDVAPDFSPQIIKASSILGKETSKTFTDLMASKRGTIGGKKAIVRADVMSKAEIRQRKSFRFNPEYQKPRWNPVKGQFEVRAEIPMELKGTRQKYWKPVESIQTIRIEKTGSWTDVPQGWNIKDVSLGKTSEISFTMDVKPKSVKISESKIDLLGVTLSKPKQPSSLFEQKISTIKQEPSTITSIYKDVKVKTPSDDAGSWKLKKGFALSTGQKSIIYDVKTFPAPKSKEVKTFDLPTLYTPKTELTISESGRIINIYKPKNVPKSPNLPDIKNQPYGNQQNLLIFEPISESKIKTQNFPRKAELPEYKLPGMKTLSYFEPQYRQAGITQPEYLAEYIPSKKEVNLNLKKMVMPKNQFKDSFTMPTTQFKDSFEISKMVNEPISSMIPESKFKTINLQPQFYGEKPSTASRLNLGMDNKTISSIKRGVGLKDFIIDITSPMDKSAIRNAQTQDVSYKYASKTIEIGDFYKKSPGAASSIARIPTSDMTDFGKKGQSYSFKEPSFEPTPDPFIEEPPIFIGDKPPKFRMPKEKGYKTSPFGQEFKFTRSLTASAFNIKTSIKSEKFVFSGLELR